MAQDMQSEIKKVRFSIPQIDPLARYCFNSAAEFEPHDSRGDVLTKWLQKFLENPVYPTTEEYLPTEYPKVGMVVLDLNAAVKQEFNEACQKLATQLKEPFMDVRGHIVSYLSMEYGRLCFRDLQIISDMFHRAEKRKAQSPNTKIPTNG